VRPSQAASKRDAALLDVWTGDVQLDGGDAVVIGKDARDFAVFVDRCATNVDQNDGAAVAQLGKLLANEPMDANSLQTNRIQHPRRRFDDPRRRMSFTLSEEQTFDRNAAQRREIYNVGVLDAVSKAPACRNQRIGQRQRTDGNGKIHVQCASASHRIRVASKTGPSMHERTKCGGPARVLVRTTQL
jgi:hypothetical protein